MESRGVRHTVTEFRRLRLLFGETLNEERLLWFGG